MKNIEKSDIDTERLNKVLSKLKDSLNDIPTQRFTRSELYELLYVFQSIKEHIPKEVYKVWKSLES